MLKIKDIKQPVSKEMALFESKFKNSLKTSVPLLDKIMHYIIKRKGKQMRPLFVFLTAKLFNNVNESKVEVNKPVHKTIEKVNKTVEKTVEETVLINEDI